MMMESLEMSESSKLEESSLMQNRVSPPILPPKGESVEEEEEEESITLSPSSPPPAIPNSSPSYKNALTKIEKFLSTPSRRIGNNSVEPVTLLNEKTLKSSSNNNNNNKEISVVDYPILTSSPFHIKRKDLLLPDPSPQPQISLQTPSGTSVGGDFASSQDDDQQRLTSGGRSEGFRAPRLPCGLTNFHLSLFFGMIGFILFWLILLLRIYLPVNYFGNEPPEGTSSPTAAVSSSSASRNITDNEHGNNSGNSSSSSSSSRTSPPLLNSRSSSSPPKSSSNRSQHQSSNKPTPPPPPIVKQAQSSSSTITSSSSSTRESATSSNPNTSLKATLDPLEPTGTTSLNPSNRNIVQTAPSSTSSSSTTRMRTSTT